MFSVSYKYKNNYTNNLHIIAKILSSIIKLLLFKYYLLKQK